MPEPAKDLRPGDGLLVVDVQKDFCPGGALAVAEGGQVVPVLNRWLATARKSNIPVYASRDWHPANHVSFQSQGGPWPPHCLQDSDGAAFHPDLDLPPEVVKITKGVRLDQDQNSAFDQTGLAQQLQRDGINRLWVGGLALDVCVLASVLDACEQGLEVFVLVAATRPVSAESGQEALDKMRRAGAVLITGA